MVLVYISNTNDGDLLNSLLLYQGFGKVISSGCNLWHSLPSRWELNSGLYLARLFYNNTIHPVKILKLKKTIKTGYDGYNALHIFQIHIEYH